jgi:sugar phosphate permease
MLSDVCGANSAQAAAIMFGMLLACMVFTSLAGFLARLIGNRRKPLIVGGTSLTIGTLTFMLWVLAHPSDTAGLMASGCILLGISVSVSPLLTSSMKEVNPEEAAATSVGFINCLSYLCVAVTTNLAGIVMDAFREQAVITPIAILYPASAYRMILLGCLIAAVVSWISSLFISETRGLCTYRKAVSFFPTNAA